MNYLHKNPLHNNPLIEGIGKYIQSMKYKS